MHFNFQFNQIFNIQLSMHFTFQFNSIFNIQFFNSTLFQPSYSGFMRVEFECQEIVRATQSPIEWNESHRYWGHHQSSNNCFREY